MKILLDTNAFLWQIGVVDGGKLGLRSKKLIGDASTIYVSAISIVEMQIKTMNGKLDAPKNCVSMVTDAGNKVLPFHGDASDKIRLFPQLARHDPFDRMLLAQAVSEQLTFMTADALLLDLGFDNVIDARI